MRSGQWDPSSYHSWPPDASTWGVLRGHRGWWVHLTKHQPDQMSCWPAVVSLLTTKCLYWEWGWHGGIEGQMGDTWGMGVTPEKSRQSIAKYSWKIKMVYWTLQTIEHEIRSMGPVTTTLGHQIPLPGGIEGHRGDGVGVHLTKHQPDPQADDMSCWPAVVSLLTTRCLYWGGGIKGADGGIGVFGGHI